MSGRAPGRRRHAGTSTGAADAGPAVPGRAPGRRRPAGRRPAARPGGATGDRPRNGGPTSGDTDRLAGRSVRGHARRQTRRRRREDRGTPVWIRIRQPTGCDSGTVFGERERERCTDACDTITGSPTADGSGQGRRRIRATVMPLSSPNTPQLSTPGGRPLGPGSEDEAGAPRRRGPFWTPRHGPSPGRRVRAVCGADSSNRPPPPAPARPPGTPRARCARRASSA